MADAFVTPPRDTGILIKLYPKDLAEVMFQAAQKKEVLTILTPMQLDIIASELSLEAEARKS